MTLTASKLRENVYRILDQVLATGVPVEIERGGKSSASAPPSRPASWPTSKRRDCIVGDPEELVHLDWSSEWNP